MGTWNQKFNRQIMQSIRADAALMPPPPPKPVLPNIPRTLVLMACSATKVETSSSIPLFDLYDGPMWQTLRKYIGAIPQRDIFVLSGKFGFSSCIMRASPYEQKISAKKVDDLIAHGLLGLKRDRVRGHVLRGSLIGQFSSDVEERPYEQVICAGSGEYRRFFEWLIAVLEAKDYILPDSPVFQTEGGIGTQRGQLGEFLRRANKTAFVERNVDSETTGAAA